LPQDSVFPLTVFFLPLSLASGRFREKASILHKIAKKKCQVDENERQNGAANHVGEFKEIPSPAFLGAGSNAGTPDPVPTQYWSTAQSFPKQEKMSPSSPSGTGQEWT
jgi:hypothetical protein